MEKFPLKLAISIGVVLPCYELEDSVVLKHIKAEAQKTSREIKEEKNLYIFWLRRKASCFAYNPLIPLTPLLSTNNWWAFLRWAGNLMNVTLSPSLRTCESTRDCFLLLQRRKFALQTSSPFFLCSFEVN